MHVNFWGAKIVFHQNKTKFSTLANVDMLNTMALSETRPNGFLPILHYLIKVIVLCSIHPHPISFFIFIVFRKRLPFGCLNKYIVVYIRNETDKMVTIVLPVDAPAEDSVTLTVKLGGDEEPTDLLLLSENNNSP